MRETIYEGKSYPEPDYDVQKAVSVSGINFFRYYPQDRLVIVAEITAEKFSCKRFYPNMPYSFADDMVFDNDRSVFLDMYKAIDCGDKKSTSIFRLKDGFTYVRMVLSVLETDENKNALTVVGMAEDVTDEIIRDRESKNREMALYQDQIRLRSINSALSSNFNNIYLVDLYDGSVRSYYISEVIKKEYGDMFDKGDYSKLIKIYVKTSVYEPDREIFEHIIDTDKLRDALNKKASNAFNYRIIRDGKIQYFQCCVVKTQIENKDYCVIAFRDINSEVIRELEQKTILEEQMAVVRGLSADYYSVMLVDYQKDTVRIKRAQKGDGKKMSDFFSSYPSWSEGIRAYTDTQVFDDKDAFYEALSREGIMNHDEDYSFKYKKITDNGYIYLKTKVTYAELEGYRIAVIGTENVDKETRQEMQMHKYEQMFLFTAANIYMGILQIELDTQMTSRIMHRDGKIIVEDVGRWDEYVKDNLAYVHPDDREMVEDFFKISRFRSLIADKNNIFGYKSIKKNEEGNYKSFFANTYLTEYDNRQYGVVVTIDNTSAVERELKQKELIEDALARAETANKAKTTFLSNMSHDIRTPMNAIIGFTTLATTHINNTEQVRNYLEKIMSASNHLLSLINDILDMSRIESGKIELEEAECSLSEIIHELRNILQADIMSKRLDFYIDTVDVFDENVICDRLRLNQILLNILGNSVKFTEPGGSISIRICQKPGKSEEYGKYEFRIKDTGIGMSEEFLAHIFEPFERERNSTVSGIQGTGLGMPITKNIVEMMGGTIEVTSSKGKGTEFVVEIPMKKVTSEAVEIKVPALEGARALVVDDDFNTCDSVSNMLIQIGMRAEWTMSGKEAILRTRQAVNRNDEYRVYVIDWLIPDMNGIEITRQIRKEVGDDVLIIILTAYDWSDIEKEGKEAGVTAFCSKPLFISNLRKCLIDILHPKKEESNSEIFKKERIKEHRLLLVEDNDLNREIASEILGAAGFIIEEAENGRIAVDKLLEKGFGYYSAVLMDVQMPVMDGYEATKLIRAFEDKALSNIPIIAMTANAFEEDKKNAFDAGMNAHISKPIDVKKLLDTLNNDIL